MNWCKPSKSIRTRKSCSTSSIEITKKVRLISTQLTSTISDLRNTIPVRNKECHLGVIAYYGRKTLRLSNNCSNASKIWLSQITDLSYLSSNCLWVRSCPNSLTRWKRSFLKTWGSRVFMSLARREFLTLRGLTDNRLLRKKMSWMKRNASHLKL